jgi:hypothetical protein
MAGRFSARKVETLIKNIVAIDFLRQRYFVKLNSKYQLFSQLFTMDINLYQLGFCFDVNRYVYKSKPVNWCELTDFDTF